MSQKDGLYRRPSGVYAVRITVPLRHRAAIGKREIHASTQTHTLAIAKIVAPSLLSELRRRFLALDRQPAMDEIQLWAGSPRLLHGDYLDLATAAEESGFDADELLTEAGEGRLQLHTKLADCNGHRAPLAAFPRECEDGHWHTVFPGPDSMPELAQSWVQTGIVRLWHTRDAATLLLDPSGERRVTCVAFDLPGAPGVVFVPATPQRIGQEDLQLLTAEVEALRVTVAAKMTRDHQEHARRGLEARQTAAIESGTRKGSTVAASRPAPAVSTFLDDCYRERSTNAKDDHRRRIRTAWTMFIELMDDPPVDQIDRTLLRRYRDEVLPKVPASRHTLVKVTGRSNASLTEMVAEAPADWPRLSQGERKKNLDWLMIFLDWLAAEQLIPSHVPAGFETEVTLPGEQRQTASEKKKAQRKPFTPDELREIFSAQWFVEGKGQLSERGTYNRFRTYYYWLPLMALHMGARINELSQLRMVNVIEAAPGHWYVKIDAQDPKESVKNPNSIRDVPIHPLLIELGFPEWARALVAAGHDRLFPELSYDPNHGYADQAIRWFSSMLKAKGWKRDGTKVFHSFRHNFINQARHMAHISDLHVAQFMGHTLTQIQGAQHYLKTDEAINLTDMIGLVRYELGPLAKFDCTEGLRAIEHARAFRERVADGKSRMRSGSRKD